jgi:cellulose synthase/poly-beta-1,6-N-acetylglucosamine synthase-like glycosyltransferase/putative flippase GtrA
MKATRASIVVPVRDEVTNAPVIVARVAQLMEMLLGFVLTVQLLFVDDSDNLETFDAIKAAAKQYAGVKELTVQTLHRRKGNRPGNPLGSALIEGLSLSEGEFVAIMDGDDQHPAKLLPEMFQKLVDGADVVLPTRWRLGGSAEGLSLVRKLISRFSGLAARLLFPSKLKGVSDPTGGFAAFRITRIALDDLRPYSWKILIEALVRSKKLKRVEIGYAFGSRESGSSKATLKQGLLYFQHLAKLRLEMWAACLHRTHRSQTSIGCALRWLNSRPWAQFALTGASGVVVQMGTLFVLLDIIGLPASKSTVLSILTAITWNYFGNRWTWRHSRPDKFTLAKFFTLRGATAYGQIAAALWVPALVYERTDGYLHVSEHLWLYAVTLAAIVVATGLNWLGNNHWVFQPGLVPAPLRASNAETVTQPSGESRRAPRSPHSPTGSPAGRHRRPSQKLGVGGRRNLRRQGHRPIPRNDHRPEFIVDDTQSTMDIPRAEDPALEPLVAAAPQKWFLRYGETIPDIKVRKVYHVPTWLRRILKTELALIAVLGIAYAFRVNAHYARTEVISGVAILLGLQAFRMFGRLLYRWSTPTRADEATKPIRYKQVKRTAVDFIMPARHENVLGDNLRNILRMVKSYPPDLVHVYLAIHEDDPETLAQTDDVLLEASHIFELFLVKGEIKKKPISLNQVLDRIQMQGHYVCPLDAETVPSEELLHAVDAILQDNPDVAILQFSVYLTNNRADKGLFGVRWGSWWRMHMVLEYRAWFLSVMGWMAAHDFLLLGGNTLFIRSDLLEYVGGWPLGLTEDAWLGIRLSAILKQLGLRIMTVPHDQFASREQTPMALWPDWFKQRRRWLQGHIEVKLSGDWRELPTLRQRLLAWETLSMPAFQALAGIILPVSLLTIFLIKVPVPAVMGASVPAAYTVVYSIAVAWIYWKFCRAFDRRVSLWHLSVLIVTLPFYQLCLSLAAMSAIVRNILGNDAWDITSKDKRKVIQHLELSGDTR